MTDKNVPTRFLKVLMIFWWVHCQLKLS